MGWSVQMMEFIYAGGRYRLVERNNRLLRWVAKTEREEGFTGNGPERYITKVYRSGI